MPPGLICLHDVGDSDEPGAREQLIDIVAVHGLNEDSIEAWTDPNTGINWLRDLLPQHVRVARVLTYGYDASPSSFLANGATTTIQRLAECLVQELYADRKFAGMRKRPIIFICHGIGGILVKKSLAYSSTRTAAKVDHLWDQFISTFAILFLGTPHESTKKSTWLWLEQQSNATRQAKLLPSRHVRPAVDDVVLLQSITAEFLPIMKQFHLFFFWEELQTTFGDRSEFVVDPSSAVLDLDNTEKAGIHATHSGMIKFSSISSSSYRTVAEAVLRYCNEAPRMISHRWSQAIPALHQMRAGEAYELGGIAFDVHTQHTLHHRDISMRGAGNNHFYPPEEARADFVGREDMLEKLQNAFFPNGNPNLLPKRKTYIVFGMGGSGKTQFCSKYAEDHRDQYTSIFTIRAASAETIKESFCKIARIGGLESTENAGRHFLAQLGEPWLLIIDNADDPTLTLRDLYPPGDRAHILVTTRNPDFRQEGSSGYLELKGLKEEEALLLLLTKADIPKPWDFTTIEAGNLIAKTLGYLALALIHAGNCIYRRICSIGDYLNLHSASRNMLQRRKVSSEEQDDNDDIIGAIYSTFEVSRKFLLKKRTIKSQDAVDLLNIVSFYHFERIPVEIFTRAVFNRQNAAQSVANSSFSSRLHKAIESRLEPPKLLPKFLKDEASQLDKYRVTWAVSELHSLSLISYDGRDYTFSLHPLVHAWIRDSLSSSQKKVWASIAFNTLMESIQLPSEGNSETDGDFHRDILPHLNSCLQVCGDPISSLASGLGTNLLRLTKFLQPTLLIIMRDQILRGAKCGYVLASRGLFEDAAHHLQIVKDTLVQLLGVQHEKSQVAMLGLATVLWGLGRLEKAIVLQSLVIDTRTQLYGGHHEKTLEAMDQLGRSYWLHGQYKEALALQKLTSSTARSTLGPKHPLTLAAIDNLGVTLGSWYRYKESQQAHHEVFMVRKELLGETHLDTLTTMSNLSMALMDLGQLEEARHMMSKVHHQRQQQLGKEHPWTLWALCYLAKIFVKMKLYKEAEEMLIWGIGAGERSLSKDHLGVLMGRGELSRIYNRQGRFREAENLLLDTIKLLEASRGPPHPDCVFAWYKLARLYEIQGDIGKAIEASRLALERADLRLTREHPLAQRLESLLLSLLDMMPDFKTSDG